MSTRKPKSSKKCQDIQGDYNINHLPPPPLKKTTHTINIGTYITLKTCLKYYFLIEYHKISIKKQN